MRCKKMCKQFILLTVTVISFLLAGCQSDRTYTQAEGNVADASVRAAEARHTADNYGKPLPSLVVNQGLYVDKTPISLTREPTWLKNRIVLRGEDLPFSYYSRTIANGGGRYILTRFQVGLDEGPKFSMNYSGTVRGALDLLASKAGYVYSVSGNNVYWQAFVTRTYDIAFMPGSADYMMGSTGAGSTASSTNTPTGGTSTSAVIDTSSSSQFSNLKGTLSVWKDVQDSIKQLMSPDGKVMVSEATTSVTVRDRPSNVALIGKFISNLNNNLSKQVLVKVQVIDITLSAGYNYGINWNIIQRFIGGGGTNLILNSQEGVPISLTALGANPTGTGTFGISQTNPTALTGYNALINALTQQGKVSVISEPRVICLNNQVSAVRILTQVGYLAAVTNTTVGGTVTGASTVSSALTPGSLTTGLILYILPKIINNKIIMQVNADLSTSNGITAFSSQTGGPPPASGGAAGSVIDVPNLTQKQFNQRSIIGSGDTLILAGFRQIQNTANATQQFDIQALGGKGAAQNNVETVVLITPVILHGTV